MQMTSPPCPQCAQPLRWFPEANAWGCDTCRQMMPVAAPVPLGPGPGGPARRGRGRAAVFLGGGVVVAAVAGIAIAVGASSSGKGSGESSGKGSGESSGDGGSAGDSGAIAAKKVAGAPAPAPRPVPPPSPTESLPPAERTGIAECDQLAVLVPRVKACAAISDNIRKTLLSMADNNLSAVQGRQVPASYADYVRPRCKGSSEALTDALQVAGCAPPQRAETRGFSAPIPAGWKSVQPRGIGPGQLFIVERMPSFGHTETSAVLIELTPYTPGSDWSGTDASCRALGERIARKPGVTLDGVSIVSTRLGRACRNLVHDRHERRLGHSINVGGRHIAGVTCSYDLAARAAPAACAEILDGITID